MCVTEGLVYRTITGIVELRDKLGHQQRNYWFYHDYPICVPRSERVIFVILANGTAFPEDQTEYLEMLVRIWFNQMLLN